ncbi:MAG: thiamine pyrophosphate-binding protein [Pseudomonadota bacterium]
MYSYADEIVRTLQRAGVNTVYGIPSVHNIGLYEALRRTPEIRHILCRQESTAAHMADGYARAGHRVGVVLTSTGPGTGYLVPAIHEAWGSCSPVLIITTNIAESRIGKGFGVLHELENQDHLFRTITKATLLARSEDHIGALTREAIDIALSGRPGPVYLEIPTNLLKNSFLNKGEGENKKAGVMALPSRLEEALDLIRHAKQPLIIVGTAAVRAGIAEDVRMIAEILGAPVMATLTAKGIVPDDHPLVFGNLVRKGIIGETRKTCDVVLAIGTRLRAADAQRRGLALPKLIHVDWDNRWMNRNFSAEIELPGDLHITVRAILQGLEGEAPKEDRFGWMKNMRQRMEQEEGSIRQANTAMSYLDAIRAALPRESTLVIDNTQLGYWAEYFYPSYCPDGLMGAKGSSTIGFAFAAAMGAKMACQERPILALIGDGGFLYSSQELSTCLRHNIGFPVIVANDGAYGVISHLQRTTYGQEYEVRLVNPDFVGLAEAYGVKGIRVCSPKGLEEALKQALGSGTMWLIELTQDFHEPPFAKY